ncbi:CMRF35-like molecule 8 [Puntigrus tetrazona]|uniref:CMRF35-like molecule 8 n=1 Tax=Puntigrus tetrazona TaxID=1606681 RepID=UPI001C89D1D3|nr:CMRF35-like molecule 8 [Puntigrus tetrazona]
MTELRAEDAGKYWCSVKDVLLLPVELMIIRKDGVSQEASVGESVNISCKHIRNQHQRFFCRGDQPNICIRDGVHVSSSNSEDHRFSLTEETSAGVFTVKIRDLREEDSGKYWCGEESSGSFIFTEVQLHVTREMTSPTSKEETEKPGSSVKVAVPVGLLLLVLVTALILFKLKHRKHGTASSSETAQEVIQDARQHSVSDPESAHLYSTVQSPTIPSDGLLYSSVSFQKHEESLSDSSVRFSEDEIHCEYASVNHSIGPK